MAKESSVERVTPITRANYLSNGPADGQNNDADFDPLTALASMVGNVERDIRASDPPQKDDVLVDMESEMVDGLHPTEPDQTILEQAWTNAQAGGQVVEAAAGDASQLGQSENFHSDQPDQYAADPVPASFDALKDAFDTAQQSQEVEGDNIPQHSVAPQELQNVHAVSEDFGQILDTQSMPETVDSQHEVDAPAMVGDNIDVPQPVDTYGHVAEIGQPSAFQQMEGSPQSHVPEVFPASTDAVNPSETTIQQFEPAANNPAAGEYLDAELAAEFDTAMAGSLAEMVNASEQGESEGVDNQSLYTQPFYDEPQTNDTVAAHNDLAMPPVETPFDHQVDEAIDTIIEEAPGHDVELGWTGELAGELEQILSSPAPEGGDNIATESEIFEEPVINDTPAPQNFAPEFASEFEVGGDSSAFEREFADQLEVSTLEDPFMHDAPPVEPQVRGGGMRMASIVLGLAILAGGGAFGWNYFATPSSDGSAKIILASTDPVKIKPKEPGGVEIPNQNQIVFDKVNGKSTAETEQVKLASGIEKPIRVVPAFSVEPISKSQSADSAPVKFDAAALPMKSAERVAATDAATARTESAIISPRKVRTVIVRPDGTIVSAVKARTVKTSTIKTASTQPIPIEVAKVGQSPLKLRLTSSDEPETNITSVKPVAGDVRSPVKVTAPKVNPVAKQVIEAPKSTLPKPVSIAPKVTQPKPVIVKAVKKATKKVVKAAPVKKAAPPVVTASTGSYLMQISSQRSAIAAQSSYNRLSRKFASILGGRGVDIRRFKLKDKGVYFRVRVPVGSKKAAINLCSRYKSAGGSCFVTR